ncbi:MAG: YceI family protein [Gallionellaceae bacterium]
MKLNIINMLCILIALSSGQISALEFKQVQAGESAVSFGYQQMGVAMEGKFNKFAAQVTFDPAKLVNAQARIDIDLASIDAGSAEANDEVAGKLWFNAKNYPTASFVSSSVKALGGNRYEVSGKLSIKGTTRDVIAPVTFQLAGNRGVFDGTFAIKRLDYKIGEGAWADLGTVANEIQIKFHVVVNAVPTKK